jgi:hypothetical protein
VLLVPSAYTVQIDEEAKNVRVFGEFFWVGQYGTRDSLRDPRRSLNSALLRTTGRH